MFFRNWLNDLALRSISARRSRRRDNQRQFPIAAELCEARQLMTATSIVLSEGTLTITGNASVDNVDVSYQSNEQQVKITHKQGSVTQTQIFDAASVTRLEFIGLAGNDVFVNKTNIASRADGGTGNDQLTGGTENDTLIGGDGNDKLFGKLGDDWMSGGAGNDSLDGDAGQDNLEGDAGNDTLSGGDGDDFLEGGDGNDKLYGQQGADILFGGAGNDNLVGDIGNDYLEGEAGNDILAGGEGDDVYGFQGSANLGQDTVKRDRSGNDDPGINTLNFGSFQAAINVDLSKTTVQQVNSLLKLKLENAGAIENVVGTLYSDMITGNKLANSLSGSSGDDTLLGQDGDDTLRGEAGDDSLDGGTGINTLDNTPATQSGSPAAASIPVRREGRDIVISGTDQIDQVFIGIDGGQIVVDLTAGALRQIQSFDSATIDRIRVALQGGDDLFANYTSLPAFVEGGAGNDQLFGGSGSDSLYGDSENDTLYGGLGFDLLQGGSGNDLMFGQDGNDFLLGGPGDDILSGDDGNDSMYGETGNDGIYGGLGDDTAEGGEGNDLIRGWLGNDYQDGGPGDDDLGGEQGDDYLIGGTGNDRLDGGDGSDFIRGDDGNDKLLGGSGQDTLEGMNGDDYLDGGADLDSVNGGPGVDTYRRNLFNATFSLGLQDNGSQPGEFINEIQDEIEDARNRRARTPSIEEEVQVPQNASGSYLTEFRSASTRDSQWDINQKGSPTCAFLAALAAHAERTSASTDLVQSIQYNPTTDMYGVQIYHNDDITTQWVTGEWTEGRDPGGNLWVTLYQKAYLQAWGVQTRDGDGRLLPHDQWTSPNGTGWKDSGNALDALTPGFSTWFSIGTASPSTIRSQVYSSMTYGMVAHSLSSGTTNGVLSNHAYMIYDAFTVNGTWQIRLYNPWGQDQVGSATDGNDDGLITLTWSQFQANFSGYYRNA